MVKKTKDMESMPQIDIKQVKRLLADQGERGWTLQQLAHQIGYTIGHVHNTVSGRRVSKQVIVKIADFFNVPVHSILVDGPDGSRNGNKPA